MQPFSNETLERVLQPIATARGLPNTAYIDADFFAWEQRELFAKGWAALGFAHEVPEPGDVKPKTFAGMPLLLVRDRAGELQVFHNVCRHRGMILIPEACNTNVLRCRYHSWAYDLNGALRRAPHVGGPGESQHEDFDYSCAGLKSVRAEVYWGVVFVNVSGEAEPFEDYIAPVSKRWADFDGAQFHGRGSQSYFELAPKCNWKLAVENYCEAYHLPWVHPDLNSYSRLEDHYNIVEQTYAGQGSLVYNPVLDESGRHFPRREGLAKQWETGAEYLALFPNVLLGAHKDHAFAIVLEPMEPGQTRECIQLFYFDSAAEGPDFQNLRQTNHMLWHKVFEEDVFAVESMQQGRFSPGYDGGVFSPVMDGPTHAFHSWMARKLQAAA